MSKSAPTILARLHERLINFAASRRFFIASLIFFVFESAWVAATATFPGAFDEDMHLGIIKFFSAHPNPFFSQQPGYLNQFGPIVHSPSYLYHYIMALPWRLITLLTDNFTIQVISMRLLNIAMFTFGIIIFRKVLHHVTNNRAAINIALLLVMLTPLTVQLAAQMNYDNMLMVLTAVDLLLVIDITKKLTKNRVDLWRLGLFLSLSLLASLVKYTFLPIFLAMILYLAWQFLKMRKRSSKGIIAIKKGYQLLNRAQKILLIFFVIVSFGLFFERYGMNVVRYHSPMPSCVRVIGAPSCSQYGIYQRGLIYASTKPTVINKDPFRFTYLWLKHMEFNLMMVINGSDRDYTTGLPLPLSNVAVIVLSVGGIILSAVFWRKLFSQPYMKLFALVIVIYLAALYATNYSSYLDTGRRVAVQGRYLIPLLPIVYLMFLQAFKYLMNHWPKAQTTMATILVLCFLTSGGVVTFIVHSDSYWYWRGNQAALQLNQNAQRLLRPVIPGSGYRPYWQSSLEF